MRIYRLFARNDGFFCLRFFPIIDANSLRGICGQPALQTDQPRNIDVFFNADIDAKVAVFLWKMTPADFPISLYPSTGLFQKSGV